MKKDGEIKLLREERWKGASQKLAAARTGMSERKDSQDVASTFTRTEDLYLSEIRRRPPLRKTGSDASDSTICGRFFFVIGR